MLKSSLEQELKTMKKRMSAAAAEKAGTEKTMSDASEELATTEKTLAADTKSVGFLAYPRPKFSPNFCPSNCSR